MDVKTCSKCGETKTVEAFHKDGDGFQSHCRTCRKKHRVANKEKIAAKDRDYYAANKEKIAAYKCDYRVANKEKTTTRNRKYAAANKEKIAAYQREYRAVNRDRLRVECKYNISLDNYQKMLYSQSGLCAICGGFNESGRSLHIDHDHSCCATAGKSCGKCVRGLLCGKCNSGLGMFRDDPELLDKAISYVRSGSDG